MRYLCGQGRTFKVESAGREGGGEEGAVAAGSAEEESEAGAVDGFEASACASVAGWRGVVFVGPVLTKALIRSGVFFCVTFSMSWKDGSSRTVVLWSEWSGTGMLEADSIMRWGESVTASRRATKVGGERCVRQDLPH